MGSHCRAAEVTSAVTSGSEAECDTEMSQGMEGLPNLVQ